MSTPDPRRGDEPGDPENDPAPDPDDGEAQRKPAHELAQDDELRAGQWQES